jgi:hypothetical protein
MSGHAQDVQVAVTDLEYEQHVQRPQRHRAVDVEEVHGQHARGLRAQVTELEQLALDPAVQLHRRPSDERGEDRPVGPVQTWCRTPSATAPPSSGS